MSNENRGIAKWKQGILDDTGISLPLALDLAYAQGRRDQRETYLTIEKQNAATVAAYECGIDEGYRRSSEKIAKLLVELAEARSELERAFKYLEQRVTPEA